MGESEMDLPIRPGASPRKSTSPKIKLEQQDIPLHTVNEKSPAMDGVSQPVEAQYLPDAIEIFKLESGGKMHIKKEIQDIRRASAHQKRLKDKYPQVDGTPIHVLEEIERLQNEYAIDGDDYILRISPECRGRICLSRFGPWLNLNRMNFPRRKKGACKGVKEYIIVPLLKDAPFGNWKPYDEDAMSEDAYQQAYKKRKTSEEPADQTVKEEINSDELDELDELDDLDEDISRLEAFAGIGANTPPDTPAVSVKVEEQTSDSELSSAKSMESIEFDESFSSGGPSATPGPVAISMAGQLRSNPLVPEPHSPTRSSPYKLQSISPTSSEANSEWEQTRSKVRKQCMHCGTRATDAWMRGPTPLRNKCQNPNCNKPRDRD